MTALGRRFRDTVLSLGGSAVTDNTSQPQSQPQPESTTTPLICLVVLLLTEHSVWSTFLSSHQLICHAQFSFCPSPAPYTHTHTHSLSHAHTYTHTTMLTHPSQEKAVTALGRRFRDTVLSLGGSEVTDNTS